MTRVNIFEAKARLSEYLDRMVKGEQIVICRRNQPVAELRPVNAARQTPRPIGRLKGRLTVPSAFFDALPDEFVESFQSSATAYPQTGHAPVRASTARETPLDPKRARLTKSRRRAKRQR